MHTQKMYNVVICAIAKNENAYINDWVNWHLALGFDHIYLFDNNDSTIPFVGDFIIETEKVTIFDVRDVRQQSIQTVCYNKFYKKYQNQFNWCLFIDIDEFLSGISDINAFIANPVFSQYSQIRLKWKLFSDNDLIERDRTIPVYQAFTEESPKGSLNNYSKSIIKSGLTNLWMGAHCGYVVKLNTPQPGCLPSGIPCNDASIITQNYSNETVFVNHYRTKSLSEFIEYKLNRGDAIKLDRILTFNYYWMSNRKTKEKEDYIEKYSAGKF